MILHANFKALLTALPSLTVYDGTVPAKPSFPYVLLMGAIPRVTERGVNRIPQGSVARYRTTLVGLTQDSVRVIAGRVCGALESTRFAAPGYKLGPVGSVPDDLPIWEDTDVTLTGGLHPQYTVIEWRFTVCSA